MIYKYKIILMLDVNVFYENWYFRVNKYSVYSFSFFEKGFDEFLFWNFGGELSFTFLDELVPNLC